MKQIQLKVIAVTDPNENMPKELNYKAEMLTLLKFPIEGLTIDQMELPLRIIPKVRNANGSVTLEEEEYQYILQRMNAAQYRFVMPEVVEMRNDIRNALSL